MAIWRRGLRSVEGVPNSTTVKPPGRNRRPDGDPPPLRPPS